ncbi:MAG: AmmeMemoRadiSam system radical SAM enzyme [Candidatus Melainabacteria bacterium]|nr:AmmeMemoRadiSam system radical SAM enzyme [Candidatus Melainabacteria bacterium]
MSEPAVLTESYRGRWWHTLEGDSCIHCDLCPRACVLKSGDRGFCFVRQNVGGQMILTTYGLSTGFCVDPVEKKPLNHFLPGTSVLSFGTAGCNLGCRFCQNWSISKSRETALLSEQATPEEIAEAAVKLKCASVAFTYNDPVIWAEYAIDTAKACHERGLKTVAVTAGYITPEARPEFYAVMDAANVDLKAFTEIFYQHLSLAHLEPVLDTLKWLKHESNVWFEITNLVIPEENDSPEEIERMCDWIVTNLGDDVPVHFTAFHPDFKLMHRPPTPPATLVRARTQAIKAGIKFAYVGNVYDVENQSTYCPGCGECLIERDWFALGVYRLKGNKCAFCGQIVPGLFDKKKGNWGRRRLPVIIEKDDVRPGLPRRAF